MTQEKFSKAKELERQINHISELISFIHTHTYKLDPPTRLTQYILQDGHDKVIFEEGEIACIRKALKDEKSRLQQEFGRL